MWQKENLGDICEILDKFRKPISKQNRVRGEYPYYGATRIVDWVDSYLFDETLVLIGEDGAKWASGEKTAFIIEGKSWVNNHAHVLRPKLNKVTHKWLTYYLNFIDLTPWITGLTVPKLNQAKLCSIPIALPSLIEQKLIVAKLDNAFAEISKLIKLTNDQFKNLSALRNIIFESITNKGIIKTKFTLKEVVNKNCTLSYGIVQPGDHYEGGIPVIRPVDMKGKFINREKLKVINPDIASSYQRTKLKGDEILMSVRGVTGSISLSSTNLKGVNVTRGIIPISLNSEILENKFAYYALLSRKVQSQIKLKTYGATIQQINVKDVKNISIEVPSLEEQRKVIPKLIRADEYLSSVELITKNKLIKLKSLEAALLKEFLT
ncbi:MAG: restriction endonuclease subunit S [Prochlorococcus marinus subsp. pastoris]